MSLTPFPSLRAERSNLQLATFYGDGWKMLRRFAPRNDGVSFVDGVIA
jgi:hypothetical protein